MFRSENKIGFRFGRDGEDQDAGQPSPLKSAMQATSAEIAREALLERARPPALPAPSATTSPLPGMRARQTDAAPLPPAPRVETAPIIAQARTVLAQPPADEEVRTLDQVLRNIDAIAARQTDHDRELRQARDLTAKISADRARLQEENQQLRDLLTSLMKTVETERRRRAETVARIGDRLKVLAAPPAEPADRAKDEAA